MEFVQVAVSMGFVLITWAFNIDLSVNWWHKTYYPIQILPILFKSSFMNIVFVRKEAFLTSQAF